MIVIRITIYWTWTFYQTLMPCVIYLTSVLNNLKIRLLFYLSYVDEGSSERLSNLLLVTQQARI